jgi:DNA-binding HxlR family transcriptional regulator
MDIAPVSAKVLTARLRRLEREGIIERTTKPTSPPTVWYSLSPIGKELSEALVKVIEVTQRLKTASV